MNVRNSGDEAGGRLDSLAWVSIIVKLNIESKSIWPNWAGRDEYGLGMINELN